MQRRQFLQLGGLALGVTACPSPAVAPRPGPCPEPPSEQPPGSPTKPFALEEKSIAELQAMMAEGGASCVSLARQYLARIEAVDAAGPQLRAILEVNAAALEIAESLDRERAQKGARGPLHGIPVVVKDNIATRGMETTAGSLALVGHPHPRDAAVVAKLRAAGALILGKANLSEWANFRSRHASSGWSSRGGQTRNPYALRRNPCGSSSGSAVAAAANLCAAAIGTETQGSIVCPSSACGVVGVKPTVGLVSRAGIIPIAASVDTAGPLTRTVADAAAILGAIDGPDPRDEATEGAGAYASRAYAEGLRLDAAAGARIGVARPLFGFHPEVDALIEEALEVLATLGAEIVDPVALSFPSELRSEVLEVFLYEFQAGVEAYLGELGAGAPKTLEAIIAFNEAREAEVMPHFGQDLLLAASQKGSLDDPAYRQALSKIRRAARREGIDRVMQKHRLDALVGPTGGPAWLTDHVTGDHFLGGSATLAAVAGYPHVTVPAGEVSSLPVGLSLFGEAFSEGRLLGLAHAFEGATKHRRPPEL